MLKLPELLLFVVVAVPVSIPLELPVLPKSIPLLLPVVGVPSALLPILPLPLLIPCASKLDPLCDCSIPLVVLANACCPATSIAATVVADAILNARFCVTLRLGFATVAVSDIVPVSETTVASSIGLSIAVSIGSISIISSRSFI